MMRYSLFVLFLMTASASVLLTSCQFFREFICDMAAESVVDPKTGQRIFVRAHENEPYGIHAGGVYKARKELKKQKKMEQIEKY